MKGETKTKGFAHLGFFSVLIGAKSEITARVRSMGQGNVFTGMLLCLGGGLPSYNAMGQADPP